MAVVLHVAIAENERGKPMSPEPSRIEKLLGIEFVSNPTKSKFALPKVPAKHPQGVPYTTSFHLTPEIARDWMIHRIIRKDVTPAHLIHDEFAPNRRFIINALTGSKGRDGWVDTLKKGQWNPGIHQGIAFTPDGFLSDGQHRTAAVLMSGVTIQVQVSLNTSWSAFTLMDSGRHRTAGQLLGDMPYADLCVGAARYILPVLAETEHREFNDKAADKQTLVDLVQGWSYFHGPWPREVTAATSTFRSGGRIPITPLLATTVMALAAGADAFEVQGFLNGLKKDFRPNDYETIGKNGSDPRWILRTAFVDNGRRSNDSHFRKNDQYGNAGLIRRCMSIWLNRNERPEEVIKLDPTPSHRDLPAVWYADQVRAFHADHVS